MKEWGGWAERQEKFIREVLRVEGRGLGPHWGYRVRGEHMRAACMSCV